MTKHIYKTGEIAPVSGIYRNANQPQHPHQTQSEYLVEATFPFPPCSNCSGDIWFQRVRDTGNEQITDYRDTLVGYFDVIGYSDYLEVVGMARAIQASEQVMSRLANYGKADLNALKIDSIVLSDSLLLILDTSRCPLNARSAVWFFASCSMILHEALLGGFPLRGAIGGGDFYLKRGESDIMVSTALVDAVNLERQQEWFGAEVSLTALKLLRTRGVDLSEAEYQPYVGFGKIPLKPNAPNAENGERDGWYIKLFTKIQNWKTCLPVSFDKDRGAVKIRNSERLYAP